MPIASPFWRVRFSRRNQAIAGATQGVDDSKEPAIDLADGLAAKFPFLGPRHLVVHASRIGEHAEDIGEEEEAVLREVSGFLRLVPLELPRREHPAVYTEIPYTGQPPIRASFRSASALKRLR